MSKRPRRSFTAEFKKEAVELVRASGKSVHRVAKDLDLTETTLREWVRRAAAGQQLTGRPAMSADREELERLRRELATVTMERDFLKKAAAFFAKQTK